MTRCALAQVPLRFVFVAAEALLHRRQARASGFDDARMTRHALAGNVGHPQVLAVVEGDGSVGSGTRRRDHRLQESVVIAVAAGARADGRQGVPATLCNRVAARATEARRLAWRAAAESRQMQLVREARSRALGARRRESGHHQQERQPAAAEQMMSSGGHRAPRSVAKSKSYAKRSSVCTSRLVYGERTTDAPHNKPTAAVGRYSSVSEYTVEVR